MGFSRSIIVVFACALAVATADLHPLSDEFIDSINSQKPAWKAGRNFAPDTPLSAITNLLGYYPNPNSSLIKVRHEADLLANVPESFDAREKWPNCPSIKEIRDQGSCGSCWAFGAVEAMTDRVCIASNGAKQFHFSAEDLVSCCTACGNGCNGGFNDAAWVYWMVQGLVSGGNYNSNQGCRPYSIAPCDHNPQELSGPLPHCKRGQKTPACSNVCEKSYNVNYNDDKMFAKKVYRLAGEEQIMAEIYQYGPVETGFSVYADFLNYKKGVYHHVQGRYLGGHAVKIIGWGVEEGVKYWLIANSWNEGFGDKGYFKFLRGSNHCDIEKDVVGGIPAFK